MRSTKYNASDEDQKEDEEEEEEEQKVVQAPQVAEVSRPPVAVQDRQEESIGPVGENGEAVEIYANEE